MNRIMIVAMMAAVTFTTPALAADVGVSISIGHPGFFGRLDLGDFPPPLVIDPRPIIIERSVTIERPPVYLRVPKNHRRNWKKHCRKYNSCGERVIFVRDDWYSREYVPRYKERHRDRREDRRDDRRDDRREDRRDDRHDDGHYRNR